MDVWEAGIQVGVVWGERKVDVWEAGIQVGENAHARALLTFMELCLVFQPPQRSGSVDSLTRTVSSRPFPTGP